MRKVFLSPATFVGGSLAGALLLAIYVGVMATGSDPAPQPSRPVATVPEPVDPLASGAPAPVGAAVPAQRDARAPVQEQPQAIAVAANSSCPSQPQSAARSADDGRFTLAGALASGAGIEPAAFVKVAREAAQQGRLRDAETALLAACHLAERRSGAQSPAVADLKARIGSMQDPAQVRVALGMPAEGPSTSVMGAARASSPEAVSANEGRGSARRLIRSDPELAQLESDIERLHAQVSRVTRDPGGLRQRDSQALARRDAACRDKACLLQWYAQRRAQLLDEF